jgi:hypothetical protein
MEINGLRVIRLKKVHGVDIPVQLQNKPERAMEYVAGYLNARNSFNRDGLPPEMKAIRERFGTVQYYTAPGFYSHDIAAFKWDDAVFLREIFPQRDLRDFSGLKKAVSEHELDAFELMERAHRNPGFIPAYAWESGDNNG